ncbi:unnamed protein product [Cladocopium goreaui]|uniref:Uncharacterized protein n=1 Tax=Cladocopium goreaui TaxID=2562237 RepID=A0A9P1GN27_9DINO|nr:unnamed protein product [Cladocopium goreaui]
MDQLELTAANYVDSDEEKDMLKEQKIKDAIEANSGFTVCILKIKFLIDEADGPEQITEEWLLSQVPRVQAIWSMQLAGQQTQQLVEPTANLLALGHMIKEHQKRHDAKHRYRMRLDKVTMIKPKKGFPKLRGRAADISGMAHCLYDLWLQFMDGGNQQHQQIRLFLKLNWELKDLLDTFSPTYGYFAMPATEHQQVMNKGLAMAQLHNQLSTHFVDHEDQLFNLTTKTHFALHSLQLSCFIHPFLVHCYKGESTMHRIQILWRSCLHGSKHWQAGKKAAWKERHLLWLQGKV